VRPFAATAGQTGAVFGDPVPARAQNLARVVAALVLEGQPCPQVGADGARNHPVQHILRAIHRAGGDAGLDRGLEYVGRAVGLDDDGPGDARAAAQE
jgi:hypothetical protein